MAVNKTRRAERGARNAKRKGWITTQGVPYVILASKEVNLFLPASIDDPTESIAFCTMLGSGIVNVIPISGDLL